MSQKQQGRKVQVKMSTVSYVLSYPGNCIRRHLLLFLSSVWRADFNKGVCLCLNVRAFTSVSREASEIRMHFETVCACMFCACLYVHKCVCQHVFDRESTTTV